MTPIRSELCEYRVRLPGSAKNARSEWTVREGLLLRLSDELGHVGQGEAAPLPGYSRDTLTDCQAALASLELDALAAVIDGDLAAALAAVTPLVSSTLPAARCAVEGAVLDLYAQRRGEPAWHSLLSLCSADATTPAPVPVAALIQADDPAARLAEARRAIQRGIDTIKLKIGRPQAFAAELAELEALRAQLPSSIELRLDANQSWSAADAARCLDALVRIAPEYVEEPTGEWDALAGSPVPLALDESLAKSGFFAASAARRRELMLRVCVLKPTLLGGITRTLELVSAANARGLDVVVTHAFEGPVAFALASALALALSGVTSTRSPGLDQHVGLSAWPETPLPMAGAVLVPSERAGLGVALLEAPR